ncbi:MAG: Ldh family oxidoreductase [Clostridia bacterium]|nr:Ldh family oxidoreductase [Clostridia bacterium]
MSMVKIEEISKRIFNIFIQAGVSPEDAAIMVDVLNDAQMKGIVTHGYVRVKKYVDCIKSGGIKPAGNPKIVWDSPSWAIADGNGGLGIVIAYKAAKLAIQKAKETGIGIINVRNSHHLGPVGYYAAMCADEGMYSMAMSNGDPLLAATGSREKNIGNNPFAYAVPAGKYDKILYDVAISMGSDMKIIQMGEENKKVPDGWMLDVDGRPSNTPADYLAGGVLLPFGGYKGYGLALMVESFAAVLSGAAVTHDVKAWNTTEGASGNVGHFIMALDLEKIGGREIYEKRIEGIIDEIKSSKLADGAEGIYYPGEKERMAKAKCLEYGVVEVLPSTLKFIKDSEEL